jgi:hypothetical protein
VVDAFIDDSIMFSPNHYFMSQIVVCCKHSAHLQLGKFSHRKQFVVISHKVVLPQRTTLNPKPLHKR